MHNHLGNFELVLSSRTVNDNRSEGPRDFRHIKHHKPSTDRVGFSDKVGITDRVGFSDKQSLTSGLSTRNDANGRADISGKADTNDHVSACYICKSWQGRDGEEYDRHMRTSHPDREGEGKGTWTEYCCRACGFGPHVQWNRVVYAHIRYMAQQQDPSHKDLLKQVTSRSNNSSTRTNEKLKTQKRTSRSDKSFAAVNKIKQNIAQNKHRRKG